MILVDFYRKTGKVPTLYFRDPYETPDYIKMQFKKPPAKALESLEAKGDKMVVTQSWKDLSSEAHRQAFTVAKVTSADLLQEIYDHMMNCVKNNKSVDEFINTMQPRLKEAGWTGASPHRLKIIFNTNLHIAQAKHKFNQMKFLGDKGYRPYWEYLPSTAEEPDPLHKEFYHLVLPYDDEFWDTYYPPSRFGCQCGVRALTEAQVKRKGIEVVTGSELLKKLADKSEELAKVIERHRDEGLKITETFKPDTKKYTSSIKARLDEMLKKNKIAKSTTGDKDTEKPEPKPRAKIDVDLRGTEYIDAIKLEIAKAIEDETLSRAKLLETLLALKDEYTKTIVDPDQRRQALAEIDKALNDPQKYAKDILGG